MHRTIMHRMATAAGVLLVGMLACNRVIVTKSAGFATAGVPAPSSLSVGPCEVGMSGAPPEICNLLVDSVRYRLLVLKLLANSETNAPRELRLEILGSRDLSAAAVQSLSLLVHGGQFIAAEGLDVRVTLVERQHNNVLASADVGYGSTVGQDRSEKAMIEVVATKIVEVVRGLAN